MEAGKTHAELPDDLYPQTPREALLMIALLTADMPGFESEQVAEIVQVALRSREDIRTTDRLGDRLAKALNLLAELRDGGADVAALSGEIDEVLAMAPDMEAMLELRGMKHRPS